MMKKMAMPLSAIATIILMMMVMTRMMIMMMMAATILPTKLLEILRVLNEPRGSLLRGELRG